MPRTIRKSRTISLRLSEREFEALKNLYAANGARSISEFIRTAMQHLIGDTHQENRALELRVQEIDGKLTILDGEVARLTNLLKGTHESH
jgi:Arc/MetJ-type ribon-helix-helix transcriptional regulator